VRVPSSRAKARLVNPGIVPAVEMPTVNSVLHAVAWTDAAGTLQSVRTLQYDASFRCGSSDDR
jgi:Zn-dependent membrane protease YugP